jgi:hypothetical protein
MHYFINVMRRFGSAPVKAESKREDTSLRRIPSPPLAPTSFGILEMAAERFDR